MKSIFFILLLATGSSLHAQGHKSPGDFIKNVPPLASSSAQSYTWYHGKEKSSPWYVQEKEIDKIITDFYQRSHNQSYQLYLLTVAFRQIPQPDFAGGKAARDPKLDVLTKQACDEIRNADERQLRINNALDNESFKNQKLVAAMDQQLIYRKNQLAALVPVYQKQVAMVYRYLESNGWNSLQEKNSYHIQIMETEGQLLALWKTVLINMRGAQEYASAVYESCKDHHEGCE